MQYDVRGGVIYISNKSKYLKNEVRYAIAVKTNLYSNIPSKVRLIDYHI